MATLTCPTCRTPYQQGDLICLTCGTNLARVRPAREEPARVRHPEQPQPQQPQQPQQYEPQQQPYQQQPRYDQPPQQYEPQPYPPQPQPQPQQPYEPQPYQPQPPYEPQPQQYEPQPYQPPNPQQNQQPPNHGQPPYDPGFPPQPPPQQYEPQPYQPQPQQPYSPYEPQPPQPQHQPPYGPLEQPPRVGPPPTPKPAREETLLPPEQRRPPVDSTAAMCPYCEAVLPSPAAAQCDKCLRPIPRHGQAPPMQPPMPQAPPTLRLQFPSGELQLQPGQHLVLGRDAGQSPVAGTFTQYDNVSRRHTTVWLDQQGTAWVRDERSTNGTFVNDERLPPGVEAPLHDGDALRLAADVTGRVTLG